MPLPEEIATAAPAKATPGGVRGLEPHQSGGVDCQIGVGALGGGNIVAAGLAALSAMAGHHRAQGALNAIAHAAAQAGTGFR